MKIVSIIILILAGIAVFVSIGVQVQPAPFAAFAGSPGTLETIPLPAGLPAPVARFYRKLYGERIPVIRSAVISGRATIRPVGPVSLPARFRFTHVAGQDYRHDIEATIFGIPVLKVIETYIASSSRQQMPWGTTENDEKANQAANLGLWAEAIWFPAIFLTDPRVHWSAVDDATAILTVPFEAGTETFVVRFDPDTHLVRSLEAMRFKTDQKVLWINETRAWAMRGGQMISTQGAVTWMDDGKPWAVFNVEEVVLNADVSATISGDQK
jgi:hypothetical protein